MQRGELYRLPPDAEGKERPVVIVSRDNLNGGHSVLAVPFTSQQIEKRRNQRWCAYFSAGEGNLDKECVALGDQVTLLRKIDINEKKGSFGRFNAVQMTRIVDAVRYALRDDSL